MNTSLMSYVGGASRGARKYTGETASGYDAKRVESPKWAAEQAIIEGIIDGLKGHYVLDVPVGTGRFIPAYERNNLLWTGVDMSPDMLHQAKDKILKPTLASLEQGDVTKLNMKDESVDLSIMCRLTRWLNPEQRTVALKELQRVTVQRIVFTARIANHPYAYPLEAIEAAIEPGWRLADNIICGEDDYRVFVLERS